MPRPPWMKGHYSNPYEYVVFKDDCYHTKFDRNRFRNVRTHASVNTFNTINKVTTVFIDNNIPTLKWFENIWYELLQRSDKLYPEQLRRVQEKESNGFCFLLKWWPSAKVKTTTNGIRWHRSMMPMIIASVKRVGWKHVRALVPWLTDQPDRRTNTTVQQHEQLELEINSWAFSGSISFLFDSYEEGVTWRMSFTTRWRIFLGSSLSGPEVHSPVCCRPGGSSRAVLGSQNHFGKPFVRLFV